MNRIVTVMVAYLWYRVIVPELMKDIGAYPNWEKKLKRKRSLGAQVITKWNAVKGSESTSGARIVSLIDIGKLAEAFEYAKINMNSRRCVGTYERDCRGKGRTGRNRKRRCRDSDSDSDDSDSECDSDDSDSSCSDSDSDYCHRRSNSLSTTGTAATALSAASLAPENEEGLFGDYNPASTRSRYTRMGYRAPLSGLAIIFTSVGTLRTLGSRHVQRVWGIRSQFW
jgi:hypothetical protein